MGTMMRGWVLLAATALSRNGGVVLHDSLHATFTHNQYAYNRTGPGASGACNGVNRRGNTYGFWSKNDTATPWPVYCSE